MNRRKFIETSGSAASGIIPGGVTQLVHEQVRLAREYMTDIVNK